VEDLFDEEELSEIEEPTSKHARKMQSEESSTKKRKFDADDVENDEITFLHFKQQNKNRRYKAAKTICENDTNEIAWL